MSKQICELCGEPEAGRKVQPMVYTLSNGQQVTIEQSGVYCGNCGEVVLDSGDLESTNELLRPAPDLDAMVEASLKGLDAIARGEKDIGWEEC